MTSLQASNSRQPTPVQQQLHASVGRSVRRGRLIASLGILVLALASLVASLLAFALVDAAVPMPTKPRIVVLLLILLVGAGVGLYCMLRPWLSGRFEMNAAEQIDRAADASDQPVVRGLTLIQSAPDDALAQGLLERAEQRAADQAQGVKPQRAYPLARLQEHAGWLALTCAGWSLFAALFPAQFMGVVSRVMTPWEQAPPFSLTQMEPTWAPNPPEHGDDVLVSVFPQGRQAEQVDLLVLDDDGNEAERFEMTADARGGFTHPLRRVESPITFKLEAYGRATRSYTIEPNPPPSPPEPDEPGSADGSDQDNPEDHPGGTTSYDPNTANPDGSPTNPDWADLQANVRGLIDALADAQAQAQSIDPADLEAAEALAQRIAELMQQAGELADQLQGIRGDLPPDAAASLGELAQALEQMSSGSLPTPPGNNPGSGESSAENPDPNNPTPPPTDQQVAESEDWLDQAADAAEQDQQRLAQGLGASDLPTESGTTSGTDEGDPPQFRDPRSSGGYDEQAISGDTGPLPDAIMQQVPPAYRDHITAYFNRLAEPQTQDTP